MGEQSALTYTRDERLEEAHPGVPHGLPRGRHVALESGVGVGRRGAVGVPRVSIRVVGLRRK